MQSWAHCLSAPALPLLSSLFSLDKLTTTLSLPHGDLIVGHRAADVDFRRAAIAKSARLEVTRLDLPLEITSGGAIFLLILGVVGFAAWNTGNNLLVPGFSLLCSTLFVGGAAARASLRDLIVSARFPDIFLLPMPHLSIVTLRNAKRLLPSFSILVAARGPSDATQQFRKRRWTRFSKRLLAYFTYVPHHAAAEQRVEQVFPKRGHVLITGFELSTLFPFGFFRFRRRFASAVR